MEIGDTVKGTSSPTSNVMFVLHDILGNEW